MNVEDTIRELFINGIKINKWILECPHRIDNNMDEWNAVIEKISQYDEILIKKSSESEFKYLISEFESGVTKITKFIEKRVVVNNIKTHILSKRVNRS